MQTVYTCEDLPDPCSASLYLAGAGSDETMNSGWRREAIHLLGKCGFPGAVIVPERRNKRAYLCPSEKAIWDVRMRARADLILFWVPEDRSAPGAYVAEGEHHLAHDICRCLYGRPRDALGHLHLDATWTTSTHKPPYDDLQAMIVDAVALIGEGAVRSGAERDVPLLVWRSDPFSAWYDALISAGHRLHSFRVRDALSFGDHDPRAPLSGFLASAAVAVSGEDRIKSNEVFIGRPDNVAVVPLFDPGGPEGEAFLVQEYRVAVRNGLGLVLSIPEGSCPGSHLKSRAIAVQELSEEVGLCVKPERLVELDSSAEHANPKQPSHKAIRIGIDRGGSSSVEAHRGRRPCPWRRRRRAHPYRATALVRANAPIA